MKNVLKFKERTLFIRGCTSDNWGSDVITSFPEGVKKNDLIIFEDYEKEPNGSNFEKEYNLKNISCFSMSNFWGASLENSETKIFLTPKFFSEPTAPETIKLLKIENVIYLSFLPVLKNSEGNLREIYKIEENKEPQLIAEGEVKRYEHVRELLMKKGLL